MADLNKNPQPLVVEGELTLQCQEGGFASDSFNVECNRKVLSLDDIVAEHFGVERLNPSGNRPIGKVRITVERIG